MSGAPGADPVRVVVAGHGMVGARLAEEVRGHDPDGRRVRLTVLAAEPRPAYNRVLLPNLLSGVMKEEDFAAPVVAGLPVVTGQEISGIPNGRVLPPDAPMTLRLRTTVIGIDPAGRTVLVRGAEGIERISYDVLVLATGARPVVPPLEGVLDDGALSAGAGHGAGKGDARTRSADRLSADVAVLHSLADARHIAAFAQAARRTGGRVAVLGGGVLGLEAARALAARGTAVTVVHRGGHPMDRQLDAAAGRVLAAALRRTGVEVSLGVGAARWESGRGLWLADGQLIRAAGLVLCTGTAPHTELAAGAGLRLTESGAIAVDDTLATSVPGIYAIGDCAGHPGAAGGLVQPGWEQAAVLASRAHRHLAPGALPGQRRGDPAEGRGHRADRPRRPAGRTGGRQRGRGAAVRGPGARTVRQARAP